MTKKVLPGSNSGDAVDTSAGNVAGDELRQFIERYEQLESEKKDIMTAQREVMAEAKGRGYDIKVVRKIIALRKRDNNDVVEEGAVMEMYMSAMGMDWPLPGMT
jgi:uncharacterized protein (UPF0335 family)